MIPDSIIAILLGGGFGGTALILLFAWMVGK